MSVFFASASNAVALGNYLGTWNASTNSPTLASSTAPLAAAGAYYIVSVAGSTTLNGVSDWTVGDWVIWNGSVWQKLEGGATTVTLGSTVITGGSSGNVVYDNGGKLGEYTTTGTAGSVVLSASPTLTGAATITGGTVTTSTPVVNVTQTFNNAAVAFTGIKANFTNTASAAGTYLADFQVGGTSQYNLSPTGDTVQTGQATIGNASALVWNGRSKIQSTVDGYVSLYNNAGTGFTGLRLGGTTSSFPMIKRNSTALETKLADDSAYANHNALSFTSTGSTWANIPAAGNAGRMHFVSNAGTKGSMWLDDGTRWKPLNGIVLLASLDAASASIGNTATNVFQYLIPAGLVQAGDNIRLELNYAKSGNTDTMALTVRCGTAGTTADTSIVSLTVLNATMRQAASIVDYRLESATSLQILPSSRINSSASMGYGGSSTAAIDAAVTISSAAANALYFTPFINSSGTTDTVQLYGAKLWLISKAN